MAEPTTSTTPTTSATNGGKQERKVIQGSMAGALTIVLVWLLHRMFEVDVPTSVAQSFTVIFAGVTAFYTR